MERCRKISDLVYGVAISDELRLTQFGLVYAMRTIPFRERYGCKSYRFGKEWREGAQRWVEIYVTR